MDVLNSEIMFMRKIIALVGVMALLASCGDDNGSLDIVFKATYDNNPLVLFDDLDYGDNKIRITQSDFYISDITLTDEDGSAILLKDIDFVDFTNTNTDLGSAESGIRFSYSDIPEGTYDMRFSVGVPQDLNSQKPEDFSSSHVLNKQGYFWDAWDSFIFQKIQGKYDVDQSGNFDLGFIFHTGTDNLYRTLLLPQPIVITSDPTEVVLTLDHKNLFLDGNQLFDIEANPANHDPDNVGPIQMIADNLASSFLVQ